jgi:PAS domain S-box-containing protein
MEESLKILIVDDNKELANNLSDILIEKGYHTIIAFDGNTAIKFSEISSFDLGIIDIKLPDINGIGLVGKLAYFLPEMDFIVITGYGTLDSTVNAIKQRSIISYILKPIEFNGLLDIINQVKDRKISERERKLAEKALKESELKYHNIFQNAQVGLFRSRIKDGKIIESNDQLAKMFGYNDTKDFKSEFFTAKSYVDKGVREKMIEEISEYGKIENFEARFYRNDGSIFWIRYSAHIYPKEGWIDGVAEDITEHKRAEEALRSSEEWNKAITETANDAIITIDSNGIILSWNKSAENIFGYSNSEMLNNTLSEIIPPQHKENHNNGLKLIKNKKELPLLGKAIEITALNKNGTEFPIELSLSTYMVNNRKYYTGIIKDITQRKLAEFELQKMSKLESLGILAGGIAHNFKNILTAMSLNVELAILKPNKTIHYLNRIFKSIGQAAALATKFQTYSKGDDLFLKPADINSIVTDAAEFVLSGSSSVVQYELEENIPMVLIDEKQMNEVITNIILNADQAMSHGGNILIKSSTKELQENEIANMKQGRYILIEIEDEGIGMPQSVINEIFTPFFTTKDEGHGLGLSSVYYIIEKHNGIIAVDSEVDKGSNFKIYLPEILAEIGSDTVDYGQRKFDKPIRIMVLDDDKEILESMFEITKNLNIDLYCSKSPEDALSNYAKSINTKPFELVILDITLKGFNKDGVNVLNDLKKINPKIKAIVFSGHSTKSIVANYESYGFIGRLEKPFMLNQFISEIKRVMNL